MTFNSRQQLELSGIGDPDHLRKIGIRVDHDRKGVGQNLQEHRGAGLKVRLTKPIFLP